MICNSSLRILTQNWYYLLPTISFEDKPFKYVFFILVILALFTHFLSCPPPINWYFTLFCFFDIRFNSVDLIPFVLCTWYVFQLLRDILLERSNAAVMARYVSSKEHLIILMNLLRVRFILHFKVDAQPLELLVLCVPECAVPLQNLSLLFVHTVRIKAKLFK